MVLRFLLCCGLPFFFLVCVCLSLFFNSETIKNTDDDNHWTEAKKMERNHFIPLNLDFKFKTKSNKNRNNTISMAVIRNTNENCIILK